MTLSRDKCKFRQTEVTYLGETLTPSGVKPDINKIRAILDYTRPTDKQDLQRLLGMINFIAKFLPKLSDVTKPLRERHSPAMHKLRKNFSRSYLHVNVSTSTCTVNT